jgi:RES domain-containing protein
VTPIDIARLPRKTLKAGTTLYRIHGAQHGPWFFAHDHGGRFNPTGSPGRGACYWAEAPLGAWVESFRAFMTWTTDDIAKRALSTIRLPAPLTVRDLTVKRALAAGVTVAVTGGDEYREPQALADALQGHADGIRYRVSHDLSGALVAVALFGDEGAPTGRRLAALPRATTEDIPEALIDQARREFGYLVLPAPF